MIKMVSMENVNKNYYDSVNDGSLRIFEMLKEEHNAFEEEYGFGNLVSVFFHELMVFYTGCLGYRNHDSRLDDSKNFDWPYVSPSYASEPSIVSERQWEKLREKYKAAAWKELVGRGVLPVSCGASMPFGYNASVLMRYFLNLVLKRENSASKVYIPSLDRQIEKIRCLLVDLNDLVRNHDDAVTVDNWVMYISGACTQKQELIKEKGILLGTRANLLNRVYAINYLQQEKNVVGFTHGEINNTILDEPIVGYADRSLCTTLVDYGASIDFMKFNQALVSPKEVVARKSIVIERIFSESHKKKSTGKIKKILYIPTLYSGWRFYGPFRQLHDDDYLFWQIKLLRALITAYGNVCVKLHPKSLAAYSASFDQFDDHLTVDYRRLEDCVQEYDLLVLDYYSTAMTIAIATSRPIVYFDIGLRNLSPEYRKLLSHRSAVRKVDPLSVHSDEIVEILNDVKSGGEMFENDISKRFSIEGGESFSFIKLVSGVVTR